MNYIEATIQKVSCSGDETILWYHYRKPSLFHLAITSLWLAFGLSMFSRAILGATEWLSAILLLIPILVIFGLPLIVTLSDAQIYVVTNYRLMIIGRFAFGRKVTKEAELERVKSIACMNQSHNSSVLFELRDERDAIHEEFDDKLARSIQPFRPLLRLLGHGLPVGIRPYANPAISFEGLRDFDPHSYFRLCELIRKTASFKGQIVP
jgi:hypothetical protein